MPEAPEWAPWRKEPVLSRKDRVARSNEEGRKLLNEGTPGQMLKGSYFATLALFGIWTNLEPDSPLWSIVKSMAILALLSVLFVFLYFLRRWDEQENLAEEVSETSGAFAVVKRCAWRFLKLSLFMLGVVFVAVLATPQLMLMVDQLVKLALE